MSIATGSGSESTKAAPAKLSRKQAALLRKQAADAKEQAARDALAKSARLSVLVQSVIDGSIQWDAPGIMSAETVGTLFIGLSVAGRREMLRACGLATTGKPEELRTRIAEWFRRRGRSLVQVAQEKIAKGEKPSPTELKALTSAVLKAECAKASIKVTGHNRETLAGLLVKHAQGKLHADYYKKVRTVSTEAAAKKQATAEKQHAKFLKAALDGKHADTMEAAEKLWGEYQRLQAIKKMLG